VVGASFFVKRPSRIHTETALVTSHDLASDYQALAAKPIP